MSEEINIIPEIVDNTSELRAKVEAIESLTRVATYSLVNEDVVIFRVFS